MPRTTPFALRSLLLAALLLPPLRTSAAQQPASAPLAFELADQFGRSWTADSVRGRSLILIAGARAQTETMKAWSDSLHRLLGADTTVARWLMVADLRGIPSFMRRYANQRAPRESHRVLLLDHEGSIARQLGLDRRSLSVVVLSASGEVRLRLMDVQPTPSQLTMVRGIALGR